MGEVILEAIGISKAFPGVQALSGANLQLRAGEVHVLMGENGAGKSTLMKILSGVYTPDAGEIRMDGKPVTIGHPGRALELGISTIYQELLLVPDLSVAENIMLGRAPRRGGFMVDWTTVRQEADRVLNQVLGAEVDVTLPVRALSVAQQQMVEIARAIARGSRVLILDEPTSALGDKDTERLFAVIRKQKAEGTALVYISHRLDEIYQIGDRATVLRDGQIVSTQMLSETTPDELIRMMVGRQLTEQYPKETVSPGEVLLDVRGVTRGQQLRNMSIQVRAGEIVGLAGLVGAGRTELARAIFGADPIDAGEIRIEGRVIKLRTPADAIEAGIGLIPEDRKSEGLVQGMSVRENTTLALVRKRLGRLMVNRAKEKEIAGRFVTDLQVKTPDLDKHVRLLSGGNQQKVVVAKWLATRSRVLIFDEPTRGIDVGAKVEIYRLMVSLAKRGDAVLMISSELPELLGMSDRILVVHRGAVAGEFSREKASQEAILKCALTGSM